MRSGSPKATASKFWSLKSQRSFAAGEYEFAVARQGKITNGSSYDELVTRILSPFSGTATSESLSVLAWIWLMTPEIPHGSHWP